MRRLPRSKTDMHTGTGPGLGSEPQPAPDLDGTGNSSPQDEVAQKTLPSVAPQRRESTPILNQSGSESSPIVSRRMSQQSLDALLRPRSSTIPLPDSAPQSSSTSRSTSIASINLRPSLDVISSAAHPISTLDAHSVPIPPSPVPSISSSYAGPTADLDAHFIPLPPSPGLSAYSSVAELAADPPQILDPHLISLPPSPVSSAHSSHGLSGLESLSFQESPVLDEGPQAHEQSETIRVGRGLSLEQIEANYNRRIEMLHGVLDHLAKGKVAQEMSRCDSGKVTILDSGPSLPYWLRHDLSSRDLKAQYYPDAPLWNLTANGINRRFIIIEDLNPWLIRFCVANLGITPEFFEEHLINSGYTDGKYNDASSKTWKTSGMKRSFVSMKWYRPALRLPVPPFSTQDLEGLLSSGNDGIEGTIGKSEYLVKYQAESNIFRSQWDLWTDLNTTTGMERMCAWQERASIWKGKAGVDLGNQLSPHHVL